MSNTINMLLHSRLDSTYQEADAGGGEITKVGDSSGNNNHGTVHGAKLVTDSQFGTCLQFNGIGDYVELTDFDPGESFTVQMWVKPDSDNNGQCFVSKHADDGDNIFLAGYWSGGVHVRIRGVTAQAGDKLTQWYHLALVVEASDGASVVTLYRDGEAFSVMQLASVVGAMVGRPWLLGMEWDGDSPSDFFSGLMANVRIYSGVLSAEQIQQDLNDDLTAATSFVASYPIDFALHDAGHLPVLYIDDDPDGNPARLEIDNTSAQAIVFDNIGDDVSGTSHHCELRFRPGTLATVDQVTLAADDLAAGWAMSSATNSDGSVSLYLLRTVVEGEATVSGEALVLGSGEQIALALQHVSADGNGGARNTQVEFIYDQNNLRYEGDSATLSGSRVQSVSIVNHGGEQQIPLHVGFVGSNKVLNDGKSPNELSLRISNTSKDDTLSLNTAGSSVPSRFIVMFDAEPNDASSDATEEWALGTESQVSNIHIHLGQLGTLANDAAGSELALAAALVEPIGAGAALTVVSKEGDSKSDVTVALDAAVGATSIVVNENVNSNAGSGVYANSNGVWKIEEEKQGIASEWVITAVDEDQNGTLVLPPGGHLQFKVANIISSLPTGHSNLYLRYENIPGYWDGQFIAVIEKAPLVWRGHAVGIGMVAPVAVLDIQSSSRTNSDNHPTLVEGLYVTGDFGSSAGGVEFRHTNGSQGIGFGYNSIYATGSNADQDLNLLPRGAGRVGIGTSSPKDKLEVRDDDANVRVRLRTTAGHDGVFRVDRDDAGAKMTIGYDDSADKVALSYGGMNGHHLTINSSGDAAVKNALSVGGGLAVEGTLEVGGGKPIILKRYGSTSTDLGDNIKKDTGYSTSDYVAAIVGFHTGNVDINENDAGNFLELYMYKEGGTWHIRAALRSHNNSDNWRVDVMFIRSGMADLVGDWSYI